MTDAFALQSRHIVTRDGVIDGVVLIREGLIAGVAPIDRARDVTGIRDLGDAWLFPGLVDTHVHVNEPGRTEWEGFESATRAAAAGGVTTIVDMPLNSIPATTTAAGLRAKRAAAEGQCHVNVGFWGGVVPGNTADLSELARAGALGFKCFLVPSGIEEFAHVTEHDLSEAVRELRRFSLPLLAHCEVPGPIEDALAAQRGADPRRYATWLASRPRAAEAKAIRMLARQRMVRGEYMPHVVHLSSVDALEEAFAAERVPDLTGLPPEWKKTFTWPRRAPFTFETCPHYLCFDAEEIPDGATQFKCAPPIRERENRDRLWKALEENLVEMIVSDHSPCPPAMKDPEGGNFMTAWGGIASLELGLSAVWTEARRRGVPLEKLVKWMSRNPAILAGLISKGGIEVGHDADLAVFDPDAEWTVEPARLQQRHKVTPYAGRRLRGVVRETYVRGRRIYEDGRFVSEPTGALVMRGGYQNRFGEPPRDLVRQSFGPGTP